jgi:hypothetical protein
MGLPQRRAGWQRRSRLIRLIGLIRPILLLLPLPKARGGQLLAVAAPVNEIPFERVDLLVEQVIGLVDQANNCIRDHGGIGVVEPAVVSAAIGGISRIGGQSD